MDEYALSHEIDELLKAIGPRKFSFTEKMLILIGKALVSILDSLLTLSQCIKYTEKGVAHGLHGPKDERRT